MLRSVLVLLAPVLAGCSVQEILPTTVPEGGTLHRCTKAEAQVAGSVVSAGGRLDACQCITAGGTLPGEMTIKLPGCEVTFRPLN